MLVFLKIFLSQGRTLRGCHITWHNHATLFATKKYNQVCVLEMNNLRFGFEVLKSKFDLGRRNTTKVSQKFVNFGESEVIKLQLFSFEILFTYQKTPSRHSQINLRLKVDTEV